MRLVVSISVCVRTAHARVHRDALLEILLHLEENMRTLTCVIAMRGQAAQHRFGWPGPVRVPVPVPRMSGSADADGGVNKVRVKRQISGIVKDLENILGDLKDVAKELKEVRETAMLMKMMKMKMWWCPSGPLVNMTFTRHGFTRVSQNQRFDSRALRLTDSCHSFVYCWCCFS